MLQLFPLASLQDTCYKPIFIALNCSRSGSYFFFNTRDVVTQIFSETTYPQTIDNSQIACA